MRGFQPLNMYVHVPFLEQRVTSCRFDSALWTRANSGLRNTIARLAIVRLLRYWETNGVDYRVGMHLLGLGKLRK